MFEGDSRNTFSAEVKMNTIVPRVYLKQPNGIE